MQSSESNPAEKIVEPDIQIKLVKPAEEEFDKNFKPTGAITFFILLVILGMIIWFGIYFLMLERI